ncbi:corrinoid protein [Christensenellaceae bacterium OttesenSCG-928-K19]|nr:corrinoid protein [Christensenellaceae bacterium OttesenSCG-928-K19]
MSVYDELSTFVQQGRAKNVKELVATALEEGKPAKEILSDGLLAGMSIIGEKFKNNEVYVPEVLIAARAMNAGIEVLKPAMEEGDADNVGKVILGTVKGDLHDIGKNLVKIMLEGKGIEVIDLGVDVPPEKFVDAAIEHDAKVIACSALLTTTMSVMKDVVDAVDAKGMKGKIKVMVGGAPVTQNFCETIGADYYASDAASASDVALSILKA